LELYRLREISRAWIRSYLTDKAQFDEIHQTDQKISKMMAVTSALKAIKRGVCTSGIRAGIPFISTIQK
jgi:hypothetical protein